MTEYKPIDIKEMMALPRKAFIDRNLAWIKHFNNGELITVDDPADCPLNLWVWHNRAKCHKQYVATIAVCPLCGNPMCPDCGNHCVEQLSRVTGYYQPVSGWNAAKQQEFKDRQRHQI